MTMPLNPKPQTLNPKPYSRGKNFKELKAAWNNDYHQTLDRDGNGKPVLENLLQGRYYLTKTNPYARPGTWRHNLEVMIYGLGVFGNSLLPPMYMAPQLARMERRLTVVIKTTGTSAEPGYGATAKGTQLDPRKPSQAMVKSLIEGDFYENRPRTSDGDKGIDFIRHNRKMTGEYSRLIAGTRSNSRLSNAAVSRQVTKP